MLRSCCYYVAVEIAGFVGRPAAEAPHEGSPGRAVVAAAATSGAAVVVADALRYSAVRGVALVASATSSVAATVVGVGSVASLFAAAEVSARG